MAETVILNKKEIAHKLKRIAYQIYEANISEQQVIIAGIMEHIEPCGIHSGDSNATLPPFNLGKLVIQQINNNTICAKMVAKHNTLPRYDI